MRRTNILTLIAFLALAAPAWAIGPDDFIGDTAIYGGETATVKPNVLIIFDTSGSMRESANIQVCEPDYDDDGIIDSKDNCPLVYNPDQKDTDGDGMGDLCDDNTSCPDSDGDGFPNINNEALCGKPQDNCINAANPLQEDSDGDGVGDECDNCIDIANADQKDSDNDGIGDLCDDDSGDIGDYDPSKNYQTNTKYCGERKWDSDKKTWKYDDKCDSDGVYYCKQNDWNNGICSDWQKITGKVKELNDNCPDTPSQPMPYETIEDALRYSPGFYVGNFRFNSDDECKQSDDTRHFATGNWINWYNTTANGTIASIPTLPVEVPLVTATPDLPAAFTSTTTDATTPGFVCTTPADQPTKNQVARTVVQDLVRGTTGVNFGLMIFDTSNEGGALVTQTIGGKSYTSEIKDMTGIHVGTTTNKDALLQIIDGLKAESYTPLAETLFTAKNYLMGEKDAINTSRSYTSPIKASCQQTYVIIITDGMPTRDNNNALRSICGNGDCDKDGKDVSTDSSDYLDDVAKYIHDIDLSAKYAGTQNALTYTIGFGAIAADKEAVKLLEDTAANGGGVPYLASNYQNLAGALSTIIGKILEVNSAFVAPVVPISPESRIDYGERVYLGFFKPVANGDWRGNLKKFGLKDGVVLDKNKALATDVNGKFDPDAVSYWSVNPDGGNVDEGGVGELLAKRDLVNNPRKIYTITGNGTVLNPIKKDLTSADNAVKLDNAKLTTTLLGVATVTDRDKIIRYVTGWDAYDQDLDGNTTEKRPWLLGDILHSKPLIQPYATFPFPAGEETSANKTVIYVGSNDGQLHAFSDATGEELWSFIPPILLPNLQHLGNNIHNYFIDGSPMRFVYDANNDGTIDTAAGDKVIILFGMRRGAGVDNLDPTLNRGAYYALDVSDPAYPALLWELTGKTSGFEELGETWSDPVVRKMRLGGSDRFVAIFGAGYDTNEDLRYGNTQTFPDGMDSFTETTLKADDFGDVASLGTSKQFTPKGRGIYIIELGSRDPGTGKVTFNDKPVKLWGYTEAFASASGTDKANIPTYSFPSSVAAVDSNFDDYIDVIYAGDTGGNLWRFRVADKTTTGKWTGTKIFSANPSDKLISGDDPPNNGRRILYPPSVVLEEKYNGVYFGTGDRAHPLNTGVTDRLYAFFDRGFHDSSYDTTVKTEADLVNVTGDDLQKADMDPPLDDCSVDPTNTSIKCLLERLESPKYSGWFIKLDQNAGEKSLAPVLVDDKKAYYTTFTPNAVSADVDPCLAGNLGLSRLYAVDYLTGEAVYNFDKTNDPENTTNLNKRAGIVKVDDKGNPTPSGEGDIFRRSDRFRLLGSGIASGVVKAGKILIGCGGGLCKEDPPWEMASGQIFWMME